MKKNSWVKVGRKWLYGIVLFVAGSAHGQTQAVKQLELDIQKLAQLKMMLNNMYNGYSILAGGYAQIKNQAMASFDLHKQYIDGLSLISPAVKNAPVIAAILSLQGQIAAEYQATLAAVKAPGVFSVKEIRELVEGCTRILERSAQNMEALQLVTTTGKLQMTEAGRLEILASLGADMEKQLAVLRNFTAEVNQMSVLRLQLKKENRHLRSSFGIIK